jgi:hypothetical protein
VGGIVTIFHNQSVMSVEKAHFPPRGWSARVESSDRTFGKGMVPILTLSKPMVPTGLTAVITFREQPAKNDRMLCKPMLRPIANLCVKAQLAVEDFLQIDFAFPFDAIIGNPPFGRLPNPPRRRTPSQ